MRIIERIYTLLKEKHITAKALCQEIGIPQQTINAWKTRMIDPPARYLIPIAKYLGVSTNFLLEGHDLPLSEFLTEDELELIRIFRTLPEKTQYEFLGRIKQTKEHQDKLAGFWLE